MNESQDAVVQLWNALRAEEIERIEHRRSLIEQGTIPREQGTAIIAHHQRIVEIYDQLINAVPFAPDSW